MRRLALLLLMVQISQLTYAQVEINGMPFNLFEETNTAELAGTNGSFLYSGDVIIPDTIEYNNVKYTVTGIGDKAFIKSKNMTSVQIPNTVKYIGEYAFSSCEGLSSITIPSSVTNIRQMAFFNCQNLSTVFIENLSSWCNIVFEGIWSNPLYGGLPLYYKGEEVVDLFIPNDVSTINASSFFNCSSIEKVNIPNSVIQIESEAFSHCNNLKEISLDNGLQIIGMGAFTECPLESISFPNSIVKLERGSFEGCNKLKEIQFGNNLSTIENDAFRNCISLEHIELPHSITTIGDAAFFSCSNLKTIKIGKNIQSIGMSAFGSLYQLKDLYCYAENIPSTETTTFDYTDTRSITLHVPVGSISKYQSVKPWKNFMKIVRIDNELEKCADPSISYYEGKLLFSCETEGVEFVSEITDSDIKRFYEDEIDLSRTYNISVYAMKNGYENSNTISGTLSWIDIDPQIGGDINYVEEIKSVPILITCRNGIIKIDGIGKGSHVEVFNTLGIMESNTISENNNVIINTNIKKNDVAIIKIKDKSIKIIMQ